MPADISQPSQSPAEEAVKEVSRLAAMIDWVRKLPITRYITIYLVFGFVLSALSLWAFSEIAEELGEGDTLVLAIDNQLANTLHDHATPTSTSLYLFISWFGAQAIWLLGPLIGLYFLVRRYWLKFIFWAIALIGGSILSSLLKDFFARARPSFANPYAVEQSFSFPSAHSMMSLILYGMIAYLLWRELKDRTTRYIIVFDAILFIILIGISRMTLGVHYLSDVLGGFSAGGLWLGACITALNFIQRHGELRQKAKQVAESAAPSS